MSFVSGGQIIYYHFMKLGEMNLLAFIKCKLWLSFSGPIDKCPDVVSPKRDSQEGIFHLHCEQIQCRHMENIL